MSTRDRMGQIGTLRALAEEARFLSEELSELEKLPQRDLNNGLLEAHAQALELAEKILRAAP